MRLNTLPLRSADPLKSEKASYLLAFCNVDYSIRWSLGTNCKMGHTCPRFPTFQPSVIGRVQMFHASP